MQPETEDHFICHLIQLSQQSYKYSESVQVLCIWKTEVQEH